MSNMPWKRTQRHRMSPGRPQTSSWFRVIRKGHFVIFASFSQTIRRRLTLPSSSAGVQPETRIRFLIRRCREDRISTLSFLRLLISKQEVAAAENVWNHLIALNQEFSTKLAFPYFRFLIAKQEVAAAQTAWQQLAGVDPSLQPYLPSRENLIVNGGFEENVLNGGFDWWYESNTHAALAIDTSDFFSGTRSLSVTFDGRNPGDAGIVQFIPVKPNTEYEFSAESRTEDIESASGPRFAIVDAYSNAPYVLTDDLLGHQSLAGCSKHDSKPAQTPI